MKLNRIFTLLALLSFISVPAVQAQTQSKNAREFLSRLSGEGGGSSGGAGNGGSNLISLFYRQALIGLQYLKLTQLLSEQELVRIHESIRNSKVYPVDFQLCALDEDTSCSDEAAMASKNYKDRKIILVDARALPRRFSQMTKAEQRRHAIHEFAGLAGIELSNHHFTSSLDSIDLYEKFSSRKQRKEYFTILGSLFLSLPDSPQSEFLGNWRKTVSLRRGQHESVKGDTDILRGNGYAFEIREHAIHRNPEADSKKADAISLDYRYNVNASDFVYERSVYSPCLISESGLQCGDPGFRKWRQVLRRHEHKYPEMFTPLELKHRTEVYPLTCKVWNEDELICRHFYYYWAAHSPVQLLLWTHEYAILKRTQTPLTSFRLEIGK